MLRMGHTPSRAEFDWFSSRLLRSYAARCAARAELRDRKCDEDRARYEAGVFWAVPDGILAMARKGSIWSLWLEWNDDYGRRLLVQGSREDVERYAIEVAVHGPPGGPDVRDQEPAWRDIGGDGTLRSLALGGEFRLMPLFDSGHILSFARNDSPLRVLGIGEAAELQRTALKRQACFRGDVLHAFVGHERVELRGVCSAGVLGYLDSVDGSRLLLGHLAGDRFGLFSVRGGTGDCVGVYDFEALRRGDLQQILGWASPDLGNDDGDDEGEGVEDDDDDGDDEGEAEGEAEGDDLAQDDAGRRVAPAPRARAARRRRPTIAARPRPAVRRTPRVRAASKPRPRSKPSTGTPSAATLHLLEGHLKVPTRIHGQGKSMVPKVFEALLGLTGLGLPDLLLRGCDLKLLIEDELNIKFHCCSKTFGQALAAVAARTPLLNAVGKRWALPLGKLLRADPELLREIARRIREAEQEDEAAAPTTTTRPPVDTHPGAEPPTMGPQPAAASTTSTHPTSTPPRAEPPTTRPQPSVNVSNTPTSEPGQTSPHAGEPAPEPEPADHLLQDMYFAVQDPRETLPDLPWLIPRDRPPPLIRRDGPLRVTLASVPVGESVSRTGKKPRGPPW
jgi:hypothetical protein